MLSGNATGTNELIEGMREAKVIGSG